MKKLAGLFKGNKSSDSNSNNKSVDEEKMKIRKKLLEKPICDWSAKDVSLWLKSIDLQDYCKEFEKMDITGAELLELTDDDLVKDLKISKLGHRKRLKKQLDYLVQHNEFLTEDDDPPSSTSNTNSTNNGNGNVNNTNTETSYQGTYIRPSFSGNNQNNDLTSYQSSMMNDNDSVHSFNSRISSNNNQNFNSNGDILIKCYDSMESSNGGSVGGGGEGATILKFSNQNQDQQSLNLNQVKMEILSRKSSSSACLNNVNQIQLKYKDEDGDVITLKKEEDFKLCLQSYLNSGQKYLKLYISSNISSNITNNGNTNNIPNKVTIGQSLNQNLEESSELIQILDGMVDAIIVMTAHDKLIKYVNKACESLLNYSSTELVGYNVTKIMPSAYRQAHDSYVDNYCRTGQAKIIGRGRLVPVKTKMGKVFDCWLSVSDSSWGNQRAFTGTLKMIYSNQPNKNESQTQQQTKQQQLTRFPFLENMVDGVIILSGNDDIIRYFNKSAEQMFGYQREEVVGREIGMLIADELVRPKHNQFVRRYMEQGDAHIVGTGRRVEALTKDGKILPIYLSVNETKWNNGQDGRCFIGTTKSLLEDKSNLSQFMK